MTSSRSETRRKTKHILLRVSPEEKDAIDENAANCGMNTAAFLRSLGQGHQVKGVLDQKAVLSLLKVNADLGRLGGLFKLWLSQSSEFEPALKDVGASDVRGLLKRLEHTQTELKKRLEQL